MREIVDIYTYLDEEGDPLFQQVRYEDKIFGFRRPSEGGGWIRNLKKTRFVIFNLPTVIEANEVFITEGEKDAKTLESMGLPATCNPGGAGKWKPEYSKFFKKKIVHICQDDDEPGRKHAEAVAESVAPYAAEVRIIPPFQNAKDVTEWVENGGTKKQLLTLAAQTPLYRSAEKSMGTDKASLPELSAPLIGGKALVKKLEIFFKRRVILPPDMAFVLAIWVIGTHLYDLFDCFPYLCITSPTKRCGKTLLAELISLIAARSKFTVNITEAALFRVIQAFQPTIIVDEAETVRNPKSERSQFLLSLLNAGHRRNGSVIRCVGPDHVPTEFPVFCPKVLLAIGTLPDTFRDRSVIVSMRRRRKEEHVERYRYREVSKKGRWRRALAAVWAAAHKKEIDTKYAEQELEFLSDREADNWAPLFAIAAVASSSRLEELKHVATRLGKAKNALDRDDSDAIRLLTDLRNILLANKLRRISTEHLLLRLQRLPESQWGDLSASRLARVLRPFGLSSRQLWIGERNLHGYEFDDLKPVFDAYVEEQPLETLEDG